MTKAKGKGSVELPVMLFVDQGSWEEWLEQHHDDSPGVRLQIAKKQSGLDSITYDEALEVALCYGWVDSQKEAWDERLWIQRFTKRGKRSIWSKVNKDKAERLIAEGRMKPPGFAAIEAAKVNGEWDKAYESQSNASLPEDFAQLLDRHPQAKAFYETLNKANQYAITFRIHSAKKPETRTKRMTQFIEMLEKGEKIYP